MASPTSSPVKRSLNVFDKTPSTPAGNVSPIKTPSTSSRFIEQLHRENDEIKSENLRLKNSNEELKKSNELVKKRRDQLVEQLSNAIHQNDTVSSLLKRKERRINDLEEQLNNLESVSEDQAFKLRNFENAKKELDMSISENARLQASYDAIVTGQQEFREHYTQQVKELKDKLNTLVIEKSEHINKNIMLINKSDTTIFRSLKSITLRSQELEEKYTKKNEQYSKVIDRLKSYSNKQNNEIASLFETSECLLEVIVKETGIDKDKLIENYYKENPLIKRPLVHEDNVANVEKEKHTEKIKITKRHERKSSTQLQHPETLEQRIHSLGKELNSSIPLKDRATRVDLTHNKSHQRNNSSSSHNQRKSSQSSRRSSRLYDEKVPSVPVSIVESGSSFSSRVSSNSDPRGVFDEAGGSEVASSNSTSRNPSGSADGVSKLDELIKHRKPSLYRAEETPQAKEIEEHGDEPILHEEHLDTQDVDNDLVGSSEKSKRRRQRRGRKSKKKSSESSQQEDGGKDIDEDKPDHEVDHIQ
jgi:hypothetical protein